MQCWTYVGIISCVVLVLFLFFSCFLLLLCCSCVFSIALLVLFRCSWVLLGYFWQRLAPAVTVSQTKMEASAQLFCSFHSWDAIPVLCKSCSQRGKADLEADCISTTGKFNFDAKIIVFLSPKEQEMRPGGRTASHKSPPNRRCPEVFSWGAKEAFAIQKLWESLRSHLLQGMALRTGDQGRIRVGSERDHKVVKEGSRRNRRGIRD